MRLPTAVDEITKEWFTAALAVRHPGVEVTNLVIRDVQWGTATKVWVDLEYNDRGAESGLPSVAVFKGGLGGHAFVDTVASMYAREARFFRDLAPQLRIGNLPTCYAAEVCDSGKTGALVLEDLGARGVRFGRATEPLTLEVAASVLDVVADFHAQWWSSPMLESLDTYPAFLPEFLFELIGNAAFWSYCMERPRAAAVPDRLRDPDQVEKALTAMWDADRGRPPCLIHGDLHLGNLFFEQDGVPGLLDWQVAMQGTWAVDVSYFCIGALSVEDRRAYERDLLRHYLEQMARHGVEITWDEAWLAYRQNALHGFLWVADPDEMQAEDINEANALRYSVAVEDLESLESLGLG